MKTDAQLQEDICAELQWEPAVHATEIGVEVRQGVVTLAGEVCSFAEKWSAERAAQRVAGVRALAIDLTVRLPSTVRRTDADIGRSAENVIEWTTTIPDQCVKVMVEGGWVTLTGEVPWQYQKHAAVDAVRSLLGVTGVSDHITLKPGVLTGAVQEQIEAALRRRAGMDAASVGVHVQGSEVTLSGKVHSWSERELARHSAWNTPGVRNVIDNMTLAS